MKFVGDNPCGWSGFDIRTAASLQNKQPFSTNTKARFPKRWKDSLPHTHVAIDDAIEQGLICVSILRENKNLPAIKFQP
jgi:transposase